MKRMSFLLAAIVVSVIAWAFTSSVVVAEDPVIAELYGRGVHAYFARDYEQAHRYLSEAINRGTQDPRAFYFRGLTYAMTGRAEEAEQDFRKGAELEVLDVDNYYQTSRSLQRVQGAVRLTLEKHRQQARLEARERAERLARAKYQEFQENERRVLLPPADARSKPILPEKAPPQEAVATDPFAGPGGATQPASDGNRPQAAGGTPAASESGRRPNAQSSSPPASSGAKDTAPAAAGTSDAKPREPDDPFAPKKPAQPGQAAPGAVDPFAPQKPSGAAPPTTESSQQNAPKKSGAFSGLLRAVRKAATPSLPSGAIPGLTPGGGSDPFGPGPKSTPGADPFAPPPNDGAKPGQPSQPGTSPPTNDPFAPPRR
jgi:hypothetical protein